MYTQVPEVLSWCWGSLSAGVYIHPSTQKAHAAELEALLDAMQYGTVVVNSTGLVGFGMMQLVWGGFPGTSTPADVQVNTCPAPHGFSATAS
jgi:hypothetical protein